MTTDQNNAETMLKYLAVGILSALAAWIWIQRNIPDQLSDSKTVHLISPAPKSPRQNASNDPDDAVSPNSQKSETNLLSEAIQKENLEFLVAAIASKQSIDPEAGFRVFEMVCERGSETDMQTILMESILLPPEQEDRIRIALSKLVDRGNIACFSWLSRSQNSRYQSIAKNYFLWEFDRKPWDRVRVHQIFSHLDTDVLQLINPIVAKCSTSDEDRIAWVIELLESRLQKTIAPIQEALLVNESNIDVVMRFMPHLSFAHYTIPKYVHLLKPSHFNAVSQIYKNRQVPSELLPYYMRQSEESLHALFDNNLAFREQLQTEWNNILRKGLITNEFKSMFEPFLKRIGTLALSDSTWTTFDASQSSLPEWDWFWRQGFRPNARTTESCKLVLAIQYQDMVLLRNVLSKDSIELQQLLTGCIFLKKLEPHAKDDETFLFFPLTEAAGTWNAQAVALILERCVIQKPWKQPSPLAAAAKAGKLDVFRLFLGSTYFVNKEWVDEFSKWAENEEANIDPFIDEIQSLDGLPNEVYQGIGILAARRGNQNQMVKSLEHFPTRRIYSGNTRKLSKESLVEMEQGWSPDCSAIVKAAIPHPKCLARLQFEGFKIGVQEVAEILRRENPESLIVALRDLETRNQCLHVPHVILNENTSTKMKSLFSSLIGVDYP